MAMRRTLAFSIPEIRQLAHSIRFAKIITKTVAIRVSCVGHLISERVALSFTLQSGARRESGPFYGAAAKTSTTHINVYNVSFQYMQLEDNLLTRIIW
jgi:hypothetical protein